MSMGGLGAFGHKRSGLLDHECADRHRMSSSRQSVARDVLRGGQSDILPEVHSSGVAASIWERKVAPDFLRWIESLSVGHLPSLRCVVPVKNVEAAVQSACAQVVLSDHPEASVLASDVAALALMAGKILDVSHVRLRLDPSQGVQCPKFHLDHVEARLLCTYRGAGTEYVSEKFLDDPVRIRQMATGHVGLFRGGLWHGAERSGLLHRSPEIGQGEGVRLLLVIDPVR